MISGNESPLAEIFCLTGCTAAGKTELALRWAEERGAEIVNCDSLLFYEGMDIGTAKPSEAERSRARHHLIDVCPVYERMDVGRYVDLAIAAVRAIQGRGKRVLVTGGSGFYLKAFFEPVVDSVEISEEAAGRAASLMEEGLEVAVSALRSLNPRGLGRLDIRNPRRVQKALERCIQTGSTIVELRSAFAQERNALVEAPKRLCVLERNAMELNHRIRVRTRQMLNAGLVEEVERLRTNGIERNPSARNAIGYRETLAYIDGEYDMETLAERIETNTRRLAKKQRTWFRGQLPESSTRVKLEGDALPELSLLFPGGS